MQPLCPAEQLALLDPRRVEPKEAVKVSLLSLVSQGVFRIEDRKSTRLNSSH